MKKKDVDLSGLDSVYHDKLKNQTKQSKVDSAGIGGDGLREPVPEYIASTNDNVIKGANNTWIVLGRDRPASRLSGYGGIGHTQAGTIDLVASRMGDNPKDGTYLDPDFETDAARIYISQKTDIDKNFKLVEGSIGNPEGFSAIGIKADSVRVIGRQGIKLVTGVDKKNSKGGKISSTQGIELIAGNNDQDLQPLPKGHNLSQSLGALCQIVVDLSDIVSTFLASQMKFNSITAAHYHYTPFYGIPSAPSDTLTAAGIETSAKQLIDCVAGLEKFNTKIPIYKNSYLTIDGDKYINSKFNKVN